MGSAWQDIAAGDFPEETVWALELQHDQDGRTYLAANVGGYPRVFVLDTEWRQVGPGVVHDAYASAWFMGFAMDPQGVPWVAGIDGSTENAVVTKLQGDSWVVIGEFPAFDGYIALDVSANGNPVVAYHSSETSMAFQEYGPTGWTQFEGGTVSTAGDWYARFVCAGPEEAYFLHNQLPPLEPVLAHYLAQQWTRIELPHLAPADPQIVATAYLRSRDMLFLAHTSVAGIWNAIDVWGLSGSNWRKAGLSLPPFHGSGYNCVALAFSPTGVPYICYPANTDDALTVMAFR
jgi:hypothetical protein